MNEIKIIKGVMTFKINQLKDKLRKRRLSLGEYKWNDLYKVSEAEYVAEIEQMEAALKFVESTISDPLEEQPDKGWIPVSEGLPDHCKDCFVRLERIGAIQSYYGVSKLNPAKTGFYVEYTDDGENPLEKVTHWKEIEPPIK